MLHYSGRIRRIPVPSSVQPIAQGTAMTTEQQSHFVIDDPRNPGSGKDYTPAEFRLLEFRKGEEDGAIRLSWQADVSDEIPEIGSPIRVWLVYASGGQACLFKGKTTSRPTKNETVTVVAEGYLQ